MPSSDLPPGFELTQRNVMSVAGEAMRLVFDAIDFTRVAELADGRTAKLSPFYEPKVDDNTGKLLAGVDVKLHKPGEDRQSAHIEFTLSITGWGGDMPLAHDADRKGETDDNGT